MNKQERHAARLERLELRRAGLPVPVASRIITPPEPLRYEPICRACDDQSNCPVLRLPFCKRNKAWIGDPVYPCPQKRF